MRLAFSSELNYSHRLRMLKSVSSLVSVGSLGGAAPTGALPPISSHRYLCTVRSHIDPVLDASIFIGDDDDLVRAAHRVYRGGGPVSAVFHSSSVSKSDQAGVFSDSCRLVAEPGGDDFILDDMGNPMRYSDHKQGGYPYAIRDQRNFWGSVELLFAEGFRQCLQLDFPGPEDDPPAGSWPFGSSLFHFFVHSDAPGDWAYVIQY